MLSVSGAAEEDIKSAQEKAVGEVPSVFLESISGGDQEEATSGMTGKWGEGVGVGSKQEAEWRRENRVGGRGNSNALETTDGSKLASNNP